MKFEFVFVGQEKAFPSASFFHEISIIRKEFHNLLLMTCRSYLQGFIKKGGQECAVARNVYAERFQYKFRSKHSRAASFLGPNKVIEMENEVIKLKTLRLAGLTHQKLKYQ